MHVLSIIGLIVCVITIAMTASAFTAFIDDRFEGHVKYALLLAVIAGVIAASHLLSVLMALE